MSKSTLSFEIRYQSRISFDIPYQTRLSFDIRYQTRLLSTSDINLDSRSTSTIKHDSRSISDTGWFKLNSISDFKRRKSTPFSGYTDPAFLHTCSVGPWQNVTNGLCVCVFCFRYFVVFVFLDICVLGDAKFPAKKTMKAVHSLTLWRGLIERVRKKSWSISKKTAWTSPPVCDENVKFTTFSSWLLTAVSVQDQLWTLRVTWNWSCAVSSSYFFSRFVLRINADMPGSTSAWNRLVQIFFFNKTVFFVRKRLNIIDLFEGLWFVGTHFRCQRQLPSP